MRLLALFAAFLMAGCVAAPARIDRAELAGLSLADRFERHAFFDDDQFGGGEHALVRWERPPVVLPAAPTAAEALHAYRPDLEATIEAIGAATGLDIDIGRPPNLLVVYGSHGDIRDAQRQIETVRSDVDPVTYVNCGATLFLAEDRPEILFAIAFIVATADPAETRNCIAQEFTQVMGLTADLDGAGDTVMDSYSTLPRLTEIDRKLLSILYDPRLWPGMSRTEAMPVVRAIIADRGW